MATNNAIDMTKVVLGKNTTNKNGIATTTLNKSSSKVTTGKGSKSTPPVGKGTTIPSNAVINKDAPNLWVRRGDSNTVTIDIYKDIKGADALNAGTDSDGVFSNTVDLGLAKGVSKGMGILGKVKQATGMAYKIQSIFKGGGNVFDKIGGLTGLSKDLTGALNIQEGTELYRAIQEGSNIISKGSGVAAKVKNTDWSNLDSIAGFANAVSGDNELFKITDLSAQGKIFASVVNEMTKNGFPDSFSEIAKGLESDVVKNMLGDVFPVTMALGDLGNLSGMVDYFGGPEINSLFPSIASDFSKGYDRQWWSGEEDDYSRYTQFNTVMDKVDPVWYKTDRAADTIFSLEKLSNASNTFKDMYYLGNQMVSDSDSKKLLGILKYVDTNGVLKVLAKDFPKTLITSNSVTVHDDNTDLIY